MIRLRVQLVLAFMLVVLFAVGAIAVLVFQRTNTHFRQYVTNSSMTASGGALAELIAYHQEQGSWDGVESVLAQATFVAEPRSVPALVWDTGPDPAPDTAAYTVANPALNAVPSTVRRLPPPATLDVTLADAMARIVYDSAGETEGKRLKSAEIAQALPVAGDGGEVIGYLLFSFPNGRDRLGELEQRFLDQMKNILITGAVLAAGLALVMGVAISRGLTAPLQRLASAARSVASGDLGQQLELEGSAEMVEVARAFNDMTTALGSSERQRQHMVADVAHELRTPLTVLQGNLKAMLDGMYPTTPAEISHLYDETRLLSRLIDDLRELALADAGQLRLHLRPVALGQIVDSTVEHLAPAAECDQVTLSALLPPDLPPVHADADRVAQVLRNLLINAMRHTPAGGSVRVTAALVAGEVELAVADTGEGIRPEDLPHIFERFWRSDPARMRPGGTGLGLSIAQSLVQAQGGRIWAESRQGEGSTFRFTLPLAPT